MKNPNVLFIMCDQLRADSINILGNNIVKTPNIDRLAKRGIIYNNAYSTCPVCIPARYTIRTGREPFNTAVYMNGPPKPIKEQPKEMEERCQSYLARTMLQNGYRTFGIGKFHTIPWNEELGYEVHLHSEELWSPKQRKEDSYAKFIAKEHPEFNFIEQLHGERTEMYYMPQMSPLPADLTVEAWASDRAVEEINKDDKRPYFGMVSFIGPHPPCAPPIPYNRMYDPDMIENPIKGNLEIDHMDEQIPWMNHLIWAEDINNSHARVLKARYYAEITYIDQCIGKILDAVEKREDADNTLICFFSDHGDHLGDHNAWQKESFFEASCNVPFLVSWPEKLPKDTSLDDLVCLTDLFGIATKASGNLEKRDGVDVLGGFLENQEKREYLFGYYGEPGTSLFKIMVRDKNWKYIYMANGGLEQLFDLSKDPNELDEKTAKCPKTTNRLRNAAIDKLMSHPALFRALDGENLKKFDYKKRPLTRIHQFDSSKEITDFTYSKN